MEILHIVRGTVSFSPGVNMTRNIDIPADWTGGTSQLLSKVEVADSADVALFKVHSLSGPLPFSGGSRDEYLGAQRVAIEYTSTAGGDIDVDFALVFTDGSEPADGYAGN
jgi:hypothetical protein